MVLYIIVGLEDGQKVTVSSLYQTRYDTAEALMVIAADAEDNGMTVDLDLNNLTLLIIDKNNMLRESYQTFKRKLL